MINEVIFRAYDIRGTIGENLFIDDAYTIGKSFGSYITTNKVLVGYDNRESSPLLCEKLINGLLDSGVDVVNIGLVTTPMLYFARNHLNIHAAIMITASHNPANDNGFKISFNELGNACGDEIKDFRDFTLKGEFNSGNGIMTFENINNDYVDLIVNNVLIKKRLRVAFDCGNGTTGIILRKIVDKLDIESHFLYEESIGTFPNHHPDPAVSSNLSDLQKYVVDNKLDFGAAFDADGDRVRLVDDKGNIINTDIFMLMIYRYIYKHMNKRQALLDVKCSKALIDGLTDLDFDIIMNRTGNSYQYRKMLEHNLEFGGEYSGHLFFGDRFKAMDDGIYAALRMVELISNIEFYPLSNITSNINKYYSTDEIKIETTEENKVILVDKVLEYCKEKGYDYNDIDGVRVTIEDSWALVRYSNTSPNLTVRFEASTALRLDSIKEEFITLINNNL